jgi:glycerophosphoryl diester phosphodiesterase
MTRALQNTPAGVRVALDHGADLVELDVAAGRDGSFVCVHGFGPGSSVADCLASLEGRAGLIAHLKGHWSEADLRALFETIRSHLPLDQVVFAAHRGSVLHRVRSVAPGARVARFGLFPALAALWKTPAWRIVFVNQIVLCRPFVRALQSRGLAVHASCVWEILPRRLVARLGVDGAFVNLHP